VDILPRTLDEPISVTLAYHVSEGVEALELMTSLGQVCKVGLDAWVGETGHPLRKDHIPPKLVVNPLGPARLLHVKHLEGRILVNIEKLILYTGTTILIMATLKAD
jgi:hypothetical protein